MGWCGIPKMDQYIETTLHGTYIQYASAGNQSKVTEHSLRSLVPVAPARRDRSEVADFMIVVKNADN